MSEQNTSREGAGKSWPNTSRRRRAISGLHEKLKSSHGKQMKKDGVFSKELLGVFTGTDFSTE